MVSAKLFLCQICQMPTHKICVCVWSALYLNGKSSKHEGYLRQPAVVFRCQENFFAVHLDRYDMVLLQQIILFQLFHKKWTQVKGTQRQPTLAQAFFLLKQTQTDSTNANFVFRWPFKIALSLGQTGEPEALVAVDEDGAPAKIYQETGKTRRFGMLRK